MFSYINPRFIFYVPLLCPLPVPLCPLSSPYILLCSLPMSLLCSLLYPSYVPSLCLHVILSLPISYCVPSLCPSRVRSCIPPMSPPYASMSSCPYILPLSPPYASMSSCPVLSFPDVPSMSPVSPCSLDETENVMILWHGLCF